ncbi:unnamed protein product [Albugo candida]|uniref:Uncharacterized protein n=1 Tax=Albugo candida TaxID=65357 RepID=A0A024G1J4_9STRA|nr:unnamed protein product [Albugo candida]|eukprot:CCI40391.1 unnamed protein product [Albugo candida]
MSSSSENTDLTSSSKLINAHHRMEDVIKICSLNIKSAPSFIQPVLKEVSDVFPDKFPDKLPPERLMNFYGHRFSSRIPSNASRKQLKAIHSFPNAQRNISLLCCTNGFSRNARYLVTTNTIFIDKFTFVVVYLDGICIFSRTKPHM